MLPDLKVKKTDLVLEIGSGHNPHPRSDILLDRYLYNDQERQRVSIRFDRPLIIAQAEHLPFADQAFDFVYCSQLIEHVKDIKLFISELSRVAKAGLIITPHLIREKMFGWSYHRWIFYPQKGQLYYLPKDNSQTSPFSHFMHTLHAHSRSLQRFTTTHEHQLNIYHYFKGNTRISPYPHNPTKLHQKSAQKLNQLLSKIDYSLTHNIHFFLTQKIHSSTTKLQNLKRQLTWQPKKNITKLTPHIRCPKCQTNLTQYQNSLNCPNQHQYPIDQHIPILLTPNQLKSGY